MLKEHNRSHVPRIEEGPVLVTGGSGFIGRHLVAACAEHYETFYTFFSHPVVATGAQGIRADISDRQMISELIKNIKPRVIFHAAALSNFNRCAENPDEAYRINVQGSENIAKGAAKINARLVYLSTDMVFDGTRSFFTEDDTPSPCCTYGRTKLAGEQVSACALDNSLIVRLSLTYGKSLTGTKSYTEELIDNLLQGQKVTLFTNEFRTPIYIWDIVEILRELAFRNDIKGILHLGGPDRLSRYEFGALVTKILSLPEVRLVPVSSKGDARFLEQRPQDCSIKSLRLSAWWHRAITAPVAGITALLCETNRI